MEALQEELAEMRRDGYASETPYQPSNEGPSTDVSNMVFVSNLPIVPEDKVGKLSGFARDKVFSKVRARARPFPLRHLAAARSLRPRFSSALP